MVWIIRKAGPEGKGKYAHRDRYNVLYGDWRAKWYGDPQERIMWCPGVFVTGLSDAEKPYPAYLGSAQLNSTFSWSYADGSGGFDRTDNTQIWHVFDVEHQVDVNAD